MADPTMRDVLDELATLRGTVARQGVTLHQQGAELAAQRRLPRYGRSARRLLPLLMAALLTALIPLATLAANPFNDLTGGVHDRNIDAIYNAGITTGCDPGVRYCPTANVTREEMASFLARTAGLGDNPPVANALTAQLAATAQRAVTAETANTVGGYAPSGLVRVARGTGYTQTALTLTDEFQAVAQLVIAAPGGGFLLASGHLTFTNPTGAVHYVEYRLREPGGEASVPSTATLPTLSNTAGATTSAFRAGAAGERAIVIEARIPTGAPGFSVGQGEITALYVPFGHNGGGTLAP
jgi:hypothetical protein